MDNSNSIPNNIPISNNLSGDISSTSNSIIDWVKSISWQTWILVFLLLAFLGFNILTFIATGTGDVGGLINTFIDKIKQGGNLMNILKNTIFVSATGTQGIVNTTANVSDEVLEKVQSTTKVGNISPDNTTIFNNSTATSTIPNTTIQKPEFTPSNQYNSALNNNTGTMNYEADDSLSNIQSAGSKSGWCYIGEDRGFRSCAEVGEGEKCMSGDIFPTNEICVNPNLRT
jgi:hypothetical protein